jgi:Peptidase family M1 domain
VTRVTLKPAAIVSALFLSACLAGAQNPPPIAPVRPAESLYLKLRSVGLDPNRVYKIRDGSLDRAAIHISLDDGTIAFAEDAGGRITGAFFRGDGEILLSPPNTTERASLALFTGAAILEEKFSVAYFRFNDDLYDQLKASFRAAEDGARFASEWNATAQNLASEDALRLLVSFTNDSHTAPGSKTGGDRFLHVFLEGDKLGAFDVRFDSLLNEQVSAGQHRTVQGENYYDVWLSFSTLRPGENPVQSDCEINQFKIRARIRPPTDLEANALVTLTPAQDGKRVLLFELSRLLVVKAVSSDGRPLEFIHNQAVEGSQLARRGNDLLAVIFPVPLRPGRRIEVSFDYAGAVLSQAANGLLYVGERGTWYPNTGLGMAAFDLEFRYPVGWTLVATGHRSEARANGAEQVSRWVSEGPMPVAGFNLGKYSRTVTRAGQVAVVTYATPNVEPALRLAPEPLVEPPVESPELMKPHAQSLLLFHTPTRPPSPSENAALVGGRAARAVEFYQRLFGAFPYSELNLTQLPGKLSQGWPGLIFLSSVAFLNPQQQAQLESDPKARLLMGLVVPHETAHQWWGDLVTWKYYRDQWIMEALANYSAMMFLESRSPQEFRRILDKYRDDLLAKNHKGLSSMDAGPVTLGLRLSSSEFPNGYEVISYGRGTWLLHMLRSMLRDAARDPAGPTRNSRDELFLEALRRLRKEYEGKPISTREFISVFESQLPRSLWYERRKSLAWFYDSWANGSAIPSLELRAVKFTPKAGTTAVTGTIIQDHAPENLVTAVPLYGSVAAKLIFLGDVFAEGHETQFHLEAPSGVRKILLDPEQTILARGK